MKYLGLDYGTKTIGIAISNSEGTIAFPRVELMNNLGVLKEIKNIIEKEHVETVIMGDTLHFSGRPNSITTGAKHFIDMLKAEISIPILEVNEVGTSAEASRLLSDVRTHNDASAAAVLLQRYLEMYGIIK